LSWLNLHVFRQAILKAFLQVKYMDIIKPASQYLYIIIPISSSAELAYPVSISIKCHFGSFRNKKTDLKERFSLRV